LKLFCFSFSSFCTHFKTSNIAVIKDGRKYVSFQLQSEQAGNRVVILNIFACHETVTIFNLYLKTHLFAHQLA